MMKLIPILTSSPVLIFIQLATSIWFLCDFFLARDSNTASTLWKTDGNIKLQSLEKVNLLVEEVKKRHCPKEYFEEPEFERVIFIVIDALGSHFLPSLNDNKNVTANQFVMPFLEGLFRKEEALAFIGKAATPTVTMPRIKALLSGTIPSFIDILYNLASDVSNFNDDNILKIAKANNKSIVFYGDDTWLSLFDRSIFTRSKETFSFFANDYTTVDTNVTEVAIPETELDPIDWDYLILHYLGLDHIGHVYGSNDVPLINEKLLQMDDVIHTIYDNMSRKRDKTLLVICGDHGMSEEGNHGGDSDLEANTLIAFLPINHQFRNTKKSSSSVEVVQQIDLAITLSFLSGMPIPSTSRGVGILGLLVRFWEPKKLSCAGLKNLLQLVNITDPLLLNSTSLQQQLTSTLEMHYKSTSSSFTRTYQNYFKLLKTIQDKHLTTIADRSNSILVGLSLALVAFLTLLDLKRRAIRLLLPTTSRMERLVCLIILVTPIVMLGSTDFIESEYIFWPLFSILTILILTSVGLQADRTLARDLELHRIGILILTLCLNSCWSHFFVIRDSFTTNILTITFLCNYMRQCCDIHKKLRTCSYLFVGSVLLYVNLEDSYIGINYTLTQRFALLVVITYTLVNVISNQSSGTNLIVIFDDTSKLISKLAVGWMTFAFLIGRKQNFIIFITNMMMEASLNYLTNILKLSVVTKTLLYSTYAQFAFYSQGNTNLFTSIDVKPAFFGQNEYNLYLAIPLVAISTYSTQIFWYLRLFQRLQSDQAVKGAASILNARNYLSLSYYMFVCIVLRNQLFIWSVISPKLFYHFVSNIILLITILLISNLYRLRNLELRIPLNKESLN